MDPDSDGCSDEIPREQRAGLEGREDCWAECVVPEEDCLEAPAGALRSTLADVETDALPFFYDGTSDVLDGLTDEESKPRGSLTVSIPPSTLLIPRSHYDPFDPGMPILSETDALDRILRHRAEPIEELTLTDFAFYVDAVNSGFEMRSLSDLGIRLGHSHLLVDGVLGRGSEKVFVRGMSAASLPIGGYFDDEQKAARGHVWVETGPSRRHKVFYRLGQPAKEYARFFEPFLWVADLARHLVSFLDQKEDEGVKVSIRHFRHDFRTWLLPRAGDTWLGQFPSPDFRTAIVANAPFLYKEAHAMLGAKAMYKHTLWSEI